MIWCWNLEKDLNEENFEEPERFLLRYCMEDDQKIVIFPTDLQLELWVKSRKLDADV